MLNFPAIKTKLDSQYNISPSQKTILEWNYNATAGVNSIQIDNVDLYTFDTEKSELKLNESSSVYNKYYESLFPATAPFSFIRPGEYAVHNNAYVGGIVKGFFGSTTSGVASYKYTEPKRNYFVSTHDNYKYWAFVRSGQSSTAVNKAISANYDRDIRVNKIVIKFETAHTIPTSYAVDLKVGGSWVEAYASTTPLTNGGLILYRGASAWSTTKHTSPSIDTNIVTATGIRLRVISVNTGYAPLEVIEISPRLEVDITSEVLNWSVDKTMFEEHEVLPIGYISSNSAEVAFDNTFNQFSYENTDAKYYGMLDKRVGIKIYAVIDSTDIIQFTGFIDSWNIEADRMATIDCYDMAKVLQQTQGSDMLVGPNTQIGKFARILFDSIGLNELQIDIGVESNNGTNVPETTSVKLFWMSQDQTFWEALQEFCISQQCVAFFDEYGRPVFKTRKKALDYATTEQVLTYESTGSVIPNIISVSQSARPRIGNLTVKYAQRGFDTQNDIESAYKAKTAVGQSAPMYQTTTFLDTLWQPEDGWTLGATPLVASIGLNDTEITVESPEIVKFVDKTGKQDFIMSSGLPSFSGYFFINGEIIYYGATRFWAVYNDGTPAGPIDIADRDQYQSKVMSNPNLVVLTHTGKLVNVKRGQFNTEKKAHSTNVSTAGTWTIEQFKIGESTSTTVGSGTPTFSIKNRTIKLSTSNATTGKAKLEAITKNEERRKHVQIARVNLKSNSYRRFETNLRFFRPDGADSKMGEIDSIAGIMFDHNADNNSGYYVELGLEGTTVGYKDLTATKEKIIENKSILIYKIKADGTREILGYGDAPKGVAKKYVGPTSTFPDSVSFDTAVNYDIQVARTKRLGSNWINLYVMGQLILQAEDKAPLSPTGVAGVFVRGDTTAEFNKFAAWDTNGTLALDQDNGSVADSALGFMTEVIVSGNMGIPTKASIGNTYDFFEFYPMMREIRIAEFDYTKYPATPIKISAGAASSSYGVAILYSTAFRAKIAVINESNYPVSLYSVFPGAASAPYPKLIGHVIKKYDSKEYKTTISTAKADDAKFELDSEWVQSEKEAIDIAEFIKKNSSIVKAGKTNDATILDMDIFMNPLLQLGDTVDVIYGPLGLNSSSHSFIISGISQSFENGLSTSVKLQEVSNV